MPTLRFVVLEHTGVDQPHFDLMVETSPGSKLATWRSPNWPIDRPTEFTRLADHRSVYLEYEGEISGGRGSVRRVSGGECKVLQHDDGAFWTIRFQVRGVPPLHLKLVENDRWLALFQCGI